MSSKPTSGPWLRDRQLLSLVVIVVFLPHWTMAVGGHDGLESGRHPELAGPVIGLRGTVLT